MSKELEGKTQGQILEAFRTYAQRGGRISLKSFLIWFGLHSSNAETQKRRRNRVDGWIRRNLASELGLKREAVKYNYNVIDVVYFVPRQRPLFQPSQPSQGLKVWTDPTLATWTGEPTTEQRLKEREKVERWQAIARDQREERKVMRRSLRVKS